MTRKIAIAALTVVLAAGSIATSTTSASAANGRKTAFAIGALVGLGGALLGAATASSQPRHVEPRRYGFQNDGYRQDDFRPAGYAPSRFVEAGDCYDKPIKRFDRATGQMIIIGATEVCE